MVDYYTKEEVDANFPNKEKIDNLLNNKENFLNDVSFGQNLKRINKESLLGKGNIDITFPKTIDWNKVDNAPDMSLFEEKTNKVKEMFNDRNNSERYPTCLAVINYINSIFPSLFSKYFKNEKITMLTDVKTQEDKDKIITFKVMEEYINSMKEE